MKNPEAAVDVAAANLTEIVETAIRFHEKRARQLRHLLHHVGAIRRVDEEGSVEEDAEIANLAERFRPNIEDDEERKVG